jgi:hypothetical protein
MLSFTHINMRGAMFGLDARIALAIFAGLATVTGATIYKVANQSRITAEAAEMRNIAKAFGNYVVDVGASPNSIEDLITSTAPGWNGPYLPYVDSTPGVPNSIGVSIMGRDVDLSLEYGPDAPAVAPDLGVPCTANNCWGWLAYNDATMDFTRMKALDVAIDGTQNGELGALRLEAVTPIASDNGTVVKYRLGSVRQR